MLGLFFFFRLSYRYCPSAPTRRLELAELVSQSTTNNRQIKNHLSHSPLFFLPLFCSSRFYYLAFSKQHWENWAWGVLNKRSERQSFFFIFDFVFHSLTPSLPPSLPPLCPPPLHPSLYHVCKLSVHFFLFFSFVSCHRWVGRRVSNNK